jgi:sulfate adenylyltransferase subunit 1 (EFTu-like GTPase family)
VYLLKQTTRTVTAEIDHGLVLNQIGSVTVSTARPVDFRSLRGEPGDRSFILIDPTTNFTAGAGMISDTVRDRASLGAAVVRPSAAEKLARLARRAQTDEEAVEAVRKALDELLN